MIGIDVLEISRIKKACENSKFIEKVFTKDEIEYFSNQKNMYQSMCGFFCAKEAVMKALKNCKQITFKQIEISHDEVGCPQVTLSGTAKEILSNRKIEVSISHSETIATAIAMIKA